MILEQRSFGRARLRLEVTDTLLRCERRTRGVRHSFESPLSEVSPTIEKWDGTAYSSYLGGLACAILLGLKLVTDSGLTPWETFLSAIFLLIGAVYFTLHARARSGSYFIVRNTRETARDIWILRSGREGEVDAFLQYLCERVNLQKKGPNQAPEPTAPSGRGSS